MAIVRQGRRAQLRPAVPAVEQCLQRSVGLDARELPDTECVGAERHAPVPGMFEMQEKLFERRRKTGQQWFINVELPPGDSWRIARHPPASERAGAIVKVMVDSA